LPKEVTRSDLKSHWSSIGTSQNQRMDGKDDFSQVLRRFRGKKVIHWKVNHVNVEAVAYPRTRT
jgi:hypothetical protein